MRPVPILLAIAFALGCDGAALPEKERPGRAAERSGSPAETPVYGYEIVNAFPHDPTAFTQGLVFHEGDFLESTGLEGRSSLRRVDLESGRVLRKIDVPAQFFAEGIAVLGSKVYQLTWVNGRGFIYDVATFTRTGEFSYDGEGWGLTHDGDSLILSDGSDRIRFLDPATAAVRRTIRVADNGVPVSQLNELEYVKGEIFANVWHESRIARIDPRDGRVQGWIDLAGLVQASEARDPQAVLNGIAYDPRQDRLFVTGKLWPKVFEIRLRRKTPAGSP